MNIVKITFAAGQVSYVETNGIKETVQVIENCRQAGNAWEVFNASPVPLWEKACLAVAGLSAKGGSLDG
jgi:hypothetical protein